MRLAIRHTSALALGSATSGLLAYAFFGVVTRALGASAAAPVALLWAYWSFVGAALTFPLQHWIARTVQANGGERSVREALVPVTLVTLAVAVSASALTWWADDRLAADARGWLPLLVGAVTVGSAAMGVVRGTLTARSRFVAVAWGLVAENAVRCLTALALLAAGVREPAAYGVCLLAGYVVALWPAAFRLAETGRRGDSSPLAFLGGAGGAQVLAQLVLTGGPVVLASSGGSPAQVTALFAGLALFRAPYTLALGVVAPVTGRLTTLVLEGREDALRRLRLGLGLATVLGGLGAAAVGALLGPTLLPLVFGDGVRLGAGLCAVVAVGSTVAMANLVATLLLLARGRTLGLTLVWALATVPGLLLLALAARWGVSALERTCWAFLVMEAAAFALLLAEDRRHRRPIRH